MKTIRKKAISTLLAAVIVLAIGATGVPANASYRSFESTYMMPFLFHEGFSNTSGGGIYDYNGNMVKSYNEVRDLDIEFSYFSNGLIMTKVLVDSYNRRYKYGYRNRNFDVVTPAWFDDAKPYSEGLAAVYDRELGAWGYIDPTGNVVLSFRYGAAYSFSEGLALVSDKYTGVQGFINKSGEMIIPNYRAGSNCEQFTNGLFFANKINDPSDRYSATTFGILDINGNFVPLTLGLREYRLFSEGLAAAMEEASGKWGFINPAGQWAIEPQYAYAYNFSEGLAAVTHDPAKSEAVKFGFIDKSGTMVIPANDFYGTTYRDSVIEFHEGLCAMENRGANMGYIDKTGRVVIPFRYSFTVSFKEGHAFASTGHDAIVLKNPLGVTPPELPALVQPPPVPLYPPALIARPTTSTVLVNGTQVAFDAYTIKDNNYFKLRDLAYVLNGTEKQFEVVYDAATDTIRMSSGRAYTVIGGEMTGRGAGEKTPILTASRVLLNGREMQFTAYNIDGNNYFKLRDIGSALNFGVFWDGATSTIRIDTSTYYSSGQ